MSDTPIYDALEKEYHKREHLSLLTDLMVEHIDSIEARDFELTEEDYEEVPAILAGAAKEAGNLLLSTFADRQAETETDRELSAYVAGLMDALTFIAYLPPPVRKIE